MKNRVAETSESTKDVFKKNIDDLDLHRYSRWMNKKHRLLVIIGFWYGSDVSKPHLGDFERTDVELLDVHSESVTTLPIGRFYHFVIQGELLPWKEQKAEIQNVF